ncbi:MAG: hypothetical protein QGG76_04705, partial [Candidatus Thalassarchaeaceae archaeon]|nr:hypothetical protein [Candidatus Thalassarchaeaceae archaeon]
VIKNKTKAKILWGMNLSITAKDFDKDGRMLDIDKVATLSLELHHVGEGTEASREFNDAIVLEDVPREFILDFETDGSMTPRVAFELASHDLAEKFGSLEEDLTAVL